MPPKPVYRAAFQVRVIGDTGEVFARSSLYFSESSEPMDKAVEEANELIAMLELIRVRARFDVAVFRQRVN
jgi:hypothetical protein